VIPLTRRRRRALTSAVLVAAIAVVAPIAGASPRQEPTTPATVPATPQSPFAFTVSAREPGWIAFTATGTQGATVAITEQVGDATKPLTSFALTDGTGGRHHGAPWRCDRRRRTFTATETLDDGTAQTHHATVTTPSCTAQLALATWPRPPRAGRPLDVTVTSTRRADRRRVRVCATRRKTRACRSATLSATGVVNTKLVLRRPGQWRLTATGPGIALTRRLHAGRRKLTILATGDSEIQVLDDQLAGAVRGRAHVIGEAHISTGLTKLGMFNWLARAKLDASAIHPDITVMSIGANDGFDLPGSHGGPVACCSQDWIDAYAARAHQMMRSYLRHGAGRVYWFLLPTPRKASFVHIYQAVDAGFVKAAAQFPAGVHVVDIRPIFSPGGAYRQNVGSVDARESDGIHLSAGGDRIALRFLLKQMRDDGTL
jgi:lysophospholipase L1-like esterase